MENASKALIIAGAILLSIAIIGIGMYVYQMAASTMNDANLSGQQIQSYNEEFNSYQGKKNGAIVRTLCDTVRTHNAQNREDKSKQIILVTGAAQDQEDASVDGSDAQAISTIKAGINAGTRYNITFGYTPTGMIKQIGIEIDK